MGLGALFEDVILALNLTQKRKLSINKFIRSSKICILVKVVENPTTPYALFRRTLYWVPVLLCNHPILALTIFISDMFDSAIL